MGKRGRNPNSARHACSSATPSRSGASSTCAAAAVACTARRARVCRADARAGAGGSEIARRSLHPLFAISSSCSESLDVLHLLGLSMYRVIRHRDRELTDHSCHLKQNNPPRGGAWLDWRIRGCISSGDIMPICIFLRNVPPREVHLHLLD